MAEVVLHIGTAKTGTTDVQQRWAHSVPALVGAGWSYPSFLEASNHMRIPSMFAASAAASSALYPELRNPDARKLAIDELAKSLDERVSPQSRWLLTSEDFSIRLRSDEGLVALQEFLGRWFDRVRILVYFRRHDFYALSLYSEQVRNPRGTSGDLDIQYLNTRTAQFGLLGMTEVLSRWERVFGADNVVARPYSESFKSAPDRLITEMHGLIGIDVPAHALSPATNSNRSLSQEAILFLREIADARDLVLKDLAADSDDARLRMVAEAYRRFEPAPGALKLLTSARFNHALGQLTPGPGVALGPDESEFLSNLIESDGRALVDLAGPSPEWNEWLAAPPAPRRTGTASISDERVAELLDKLKRYRRLSHRLSRRLKRVRPSAYGA